ncbi:zf-CCHC domain-containing protein [Tanacetum coccineum]
MMMNNTSLDSNEEEYAMLRGKFIRQPYDDKKNFQKIKEEKREDRRCFKCGDPNHFISDCPKNSFGDQKAFVVGSWSDSGDDSKKEEICLMAHSNEVLSDNLYYSSSSLDNESRENEYDKLGQISLRIINKNKHLKAKNESLKKTINELKTKLDILEKCKETSSNCNACSELRLEVNSLKLKLASIEYSSLSLKKMVEMQKPSKDKCGLGYTETIASPRNTKIKNLGDQLEKLSVEPAGRCHSSTAPACSNEQHRASDDSVEKEKDLETNVKLDPDKWIQDSGSTRHMTGNKDLFSSYKTFDEGNVLFGSNTKRKIIGKGDGSASGLNRGRGSASGSNMGRGSASSSNRGRGRVSGSNKVFVQKPVVEKYILIDEEDLVDVQVEEEVDTRDENVVGENVVAEVVEQDEKEDEAARLKKRMRHIL